MLFAWLPKINAQQNGASCPSSTCNLRVMSIHFIIHQGPGPLSKPSSNVVCSTQPQHWRTPYSLLNSAYQISIKHLLHCGTSSNYLWLFICLTETKEGTKKCSCQNSWRICWQRLTSDFLALIWTMTSSAPVSLSASSGLGGCCSHSAAVCSLTDDEVTASTDALSFVDDVTRWASTSVFRLSDTACFNSWGRKHVWSKHR